VSSLSDHDKQLINELAERALLELLAHHPELGSLDSETLSLIFLAGVRAGAQAMLPATLERNGGDK